MRPEVVDALKRAGVEELHRSTLDAGEDLTALSSAPVDLESLGARSVALEAVDQLAMEHLLCVR